MINQNNKNTSRRKIAHLSTVGTTQIHLRNPRIIAWWSAAFPGMGHLLLSKYLRGFLLFVWEVIINMQANINMAIYYSFIGEFHQAKEVLNKEWMLLYIPIYIFAIWDSYRTTVDMNNVYKLASREDAEIKAFNIGAMEINYLDKRSPANAFVWSALMPGIGQLYIHRIITATFVLIWWIMVIYLANLLPAIHYSLLGQIAEAKEVLDIHWMMNSPSIYGFAVYDAYVNTVENNRLYNWEQSKFLKRQYQFEGFNMPLKDVKYRRDNMYIIATFEHNNYLELAITAVEMKGVLKERILAVPLDKRGESRRLFDTLHYSDGLSLLDLGAALGTIFMLLGSIYGFILRWGPIWWGLIGLFTGFFLGFIIKLVTTKKYEKNRSNLQKTSEVVLMIECQQEELEKIKNTLWENHALGVAQLDFHHTA
ncbi:hypothetical protein SAMN05660297_00955 [Natronincola peptidivorans]|uniref:Uncharacterized protein n=1 Tax=Natronincola peptidivorans TaxID=426128 RepID=A0A1I0AKR8_9FIRM|nr:hypothetical protein [Natronincola peptidivorans]SES94456.1 hypothetical protein SAMN05660297_00955 [Natronincola peptidivorans]